MPFYFNAGVITIFLNSIGPIALGRKNYLFAGGHEPAQDAAMLYSLFATCRLHNINPEHWLTNLFEKINITPKEQLHQLLPGAYQTGGKIRQQTSPGNDGVGRGDTYDARAMSHQCLKGSYNEPLQM